MDNYANYGIEVPHGATGEYRAICPQCTPGRKSQHQRERDLCVNVDKGVWECKHCSWTGGLKAKGNTAPQYIRPQFNPASLKLPTGVVEWFKGRGISTETLGTMKVGYEGNGKNGYIQFPFFKAGAVVNIKHRTADKRMWQGKNPEPCFYNHDGAIAAGGETLVICEGEIDCLSFVEAGVPACVSVPNGAPTPSAKTLDNAMAYLDADKGLVAKFQRVILAVDNDQPGKRLEEELTKRIGPDKCYRVTYPVGCKDGNDVLVKHGAERLREVILRAKPCPIDGLFQPMDLLDSVQSLYDQGLRRGLSTGWSSVDEFYTVRTCEMTIVTGIPGSGKSTWLDALAVNLWRQHGWKFAYCSPENWPLERHMAALLEKVSGKPFAASTRNSARMDMGELAEALEKMQGAFFFTQLDDDAMGIDSILGIMQAAISRHGVNGIILDPWNELEHHRPADLTETEFVSLALGKIRRFARLNHVHVWIVAHPTKLRKGDDGKYPVPRLYDISGSAHWYNKADNGITVHRPDPKSAKTQVYVGKVRFREIGKIGMAELNYTYDCGTYSEASVFKDNFSSPTLKQGYSDWNDMRAPQ